MKFIYFIVCLNILSDINFIICQNEYNFNDVALHTDSREFVHPQSKIYQIEPENDICKKPTFYEKKISVIVIGAGISGISTATYLKNSMKDIDIKIIEARNRWGGRIHTDKTTFSAPVDFGGFMYFISDTHPLNQFLKKKNITLNPTIEGGRDRHSLMNGKHITKEETAPLIDSMKEKLTKFLEELDEDLEFTYQELKDLFNTKEPMNKFEEYYYNSCFNVTFYSQEEDIRTIKDIKTYFNVVEKDKGSERHPVSFIPDGYFSVVDHLLVDLEAQFNTTIIKIVRNDNNVTIYDTDGNSYTADHVVCTIPLKVLKSGMVTFEPDLSDEKDDLFRIVPVGSFNKIIVEFEEKFWGDYDSYVLYNDYEIMVSSFINFHKVTGKNILIFPYGSEGFKSIGEFSIEKLTEDITSLMKDNFPGKNIKIKKLERSNWGNDPYALGTFSCFYGTCYDVYFDMLSEPEGRLHFAGEHTQSGFIGLRKAWHSGFRAATEILNTLKNMC